jgi:hypothetical protein
MDTGIAVTAGTPVTISASGQWTPDGQNYAGPDGFGYSTESADNYFNVTDLGACASCASTLSPNWGTVDQLYR